MARNSFVQTTATEVQIPAGGAFKTVLQLLAGSVPIAIRGINVTGDGTSGSAEPLIVRLVKQTDAGTGGTTRNPSKTSDIATALAVTGQVGPTTGAWTAEPGLDATPVIYRQFHIHPQAGALYPFDEVVIAGAGRVGVQIAAPAQVNVLVQIDGEE